ncbi:MAG: sugar phosphate isomerase/epimerase [Dehalococcoidia bacterium]|nr:sugar phosphate isomerase/epimerase [Dehalococcoidia bacterium]
MKLGCSSWSYHAAFRAGRIDLREWLRRCAEEMEFDGVELADVHFPTTDPAYLRELKKLCIDLQLTIAGVAVTNDFASPETRAGECAKVRQWCDVAALLGAPVVRVFAGWAQAAPMPAAAPDPGRIVGLFRRVFGPPQRDVRRTWSDLAWALRESATHGAERGVALALQNSQRAGVVRTAQELDQCLRDVGSPWLRVCLDPADLPHRAGIDAVLRKTVQTHARVHDVQDDGSDAAVHWPEVLRLLRLAGYRGFVLLDYDGDEDPETAVPRSARYLRAILQTLARRELLTAPDATISTNGFSSANGARDPAVEATPAP